MHPNQHQTDAAARDYRALHLGLIPELANLIGPRRSSVFADEKGHAADMTKDAGTLIWLNAIYGINPLELPPIERYGVDIREIAASALTTSP